MNNKAALLKMGEYDSLDATVKKRIIKQVEQEYLSYLFLSNSSNRLHSQLKKDVANDYSKGNTEAYPTDIHKALTLMNEYKPLKLNTPTVPAQGTAFAIKGMEAKKKAGHKRDAAGGKFLKAAEWNALSPEEQEKIIQARKKARAKGNDDDDKSTMSNKSMRSLSKTIKSLEKSNHKLRKSVSALQKCEEDDNSLISSSEGTTHFQVDLDLFEERNPKIALAFKSSKHDDLELRNVLLLDNQFTFDLCCNKKFTSQILRAKNPLLMTSNGGGLKISHKCKIPGYKYQGWFSSKAITNIICLKNLIKCYRVIYDSEVDTTFVVHCSQRLKKLSFRVGVGRLKFSESWQS